MAANECAVCGHTEALHDAIFTKACIHRDYLGLAYASCPCRKFIGERTPRKPAIYGRATTIEGPRATIKRGREDAYADSVTNLLDAARGDA